MTVAEKTDALHSFYRVGNPIKDAHTIDDALKQAGLDFTISQHELFTIGRDYHKDEDGNYILDSFGRPLYQSIKVNQTSPTTFETSAPSEYHGLTFPQMAMIVRDDTKQPISVMGSGYKVVQNDECVQIMADIMEESKKTGTELVLFRGGCVRGCDFLFLAAKLPEDMEIPNPDGEDYILHRYIVCTWSHTGSGKIQISFVTHAPRFNTMLYTGESYLNASVRHTKTASNRIKEANKYLNKAYKSFTRFSTLLHEMADKKMDFNVFDKFLSETIFALPEDTDMTTKGGKLKMTRLMNKRKAVTERFREIKGSNALDGFIATCSYADNDTTVKQKKEGREEHTIKSEGELRLLSSFKGTGSQLKTNTIKALSSWD